MLEILHASSHHGNKAPGVGQKQSNDNSNRLRNKTTTNGLIKPVPRALGRARLTITHRSRGINNRPECQ